MRNLCGVALAMLALIGSAPAAEDSGATADGGWARAPAGAGGTMAVYMTLHGGAEADRLVAVEIPVAGMAMLHQSASANNVSTMRMTGGVDIPAHGTVVLRPGGLHVMLEDLAARPAPGAELHVKLRFAHARPVDLTVAVRPPGTPGL